MQKAIFSSGTSRGGTTFFARMLSVNPLIKIASDPYLPLFKHLYRALQKQRSGQEISLNTPLPDYYFSKEGIDTIDFIQQKNIDIEFPQENLDSLKTACHSRMLLAAKEAAPFCRELSGKTYKELFSSGIDILRKSYNIDETTWCGFNDNWVSEFFPLLAKTFEEARFIVMIRDPRACVASILKLRQKHEQLAPFIYSFLRCWRKHVAFATHFQTQPLFQKRLHVIRYEDLAQHPQSQAERLCQFLGVAYSNAMLDTKQFRPVKGETWAGYSHFENNPKEGIYTTGIDNWKNHLDPKMARFIEFVCLPEMILFGYEPLFYKGEGVFEEILETYREEEKLAKGWRLKHDSCDIEMTRETLRHQLLQSTSRNSDPKKLRENFLFLETFDKINRSFQHRDNI